MMGDFCDWCLNGENLEDMKVVNILPSSKRQDSKASKIVLSDNSSFTNRSYGRQSKN